MKLRRLFFALLALPLAFAACEPEPTPTPEPEPDKTTVLTLTSEDTLDFTAEGGQGVIEYELVEETRNTPVPMPMVEATCDADWVADIAVAEDITFNVAANEGEARATKVVVTYGNQMFEVAVNQAAKAVEPDPKPEYEMDVRLAAAMRIPSAELDMPNNIFALVFVDDAESLELGVVLAGAADDTVLKAGNYNTESETLYADESALYLYDTDTEYAFASGFVAVSLDDDSYAFDIELTAADGKLYHFTYEGVVLDMEPTDAPEPETFEPVKVEAYRSASWKLGNFELDLYINDEVYHSLDMQDNINPNENYLSEGVYTMDNGGVTSWSNFVWDIETGEGAYVVDAEITIAHNADGTTTITGFFESEYGNHLDINWTGIVEGFSFPAESLSTLSSDLVLNESGFTYHAHYQGDWYTWDTDNWWIEIYENDATMSGKYLMLDLLVNPSQDDFCGIYSHRTEANYMNTFVVGDVNGENRVGCWYAEVENNKITGDKAPFIDGTIEIVSNADGSVTFTFDCVDDAGNKISGSVTAAAPATF